MPKLLIVDDRPEFPVRFVRTAERVRRDFEIHEASSGRAALEKLRAEEFDVLIVPSWLAGPLSAAGTALMAAALRPRLVALVVSHVKGAGSSPSGCLHAFAHDLAADDQVAAVAEILDGAATSVSKMTAADVLWLTYATQSTLQISVRDETTRGGIVFRQGNPVASRFGNTLGADALVDVLAADDGTLVVETRVADVDPNILGSYPDIIDELIARADAKRQEEAAKNEVIEISDQDLEAFIPAEDPMSLFSEDELAEMAFDLPEDAEIIGDPSAAPPPLPAAPAKASGEGVPQIGAVLDKILSQGEDFLAVALVSLIDGTVLGVATAGDAPPMQALVSTYTTAALRLADGVNVGAEARPLREFTVHGRARSVVMVGLDGTRLAALAVTRRSANASVTRGYLRARSTPLTTIIQGDA